MGVVVEKSTKTSSQCSAAVKMVNCLFGLIRKAVEDNVATIVMSQLKIYNEDTLGIMCTACPS